MPRLTDPAAIRAILATDRPWSVYATGDLAPGLFEHCSWYRTERQPLALALIYRGFSVPVLFTIGPPEGVAELLGEIAAEPSLYLHVRPEILPVLRARYAVAEEKPMWRMLLDRTSYRPVPVERAARLTLADLEAVRRLYADGQQTGETPEFFFPSMLEQGVFFGIREGGELVSVAGTHLAVPAEGVAALGNVYTRRDRRGRGLAGEATSAAANELLRDGVDVIALNVNQKNRPAIRTYDRLGFVPYCEFLEGVATRLRIRARSRRGANQR